jgi:hypothetical protein
VKNWRCLLRIGRLGLCHGRWKKGCERATFKDLKGCFRIDELTDCICSNETKIIEIEREISAHRLFSNIWNCGKWK